MTSETLFQNNFILRKPRIAIFADIVKIVIIFIKTILRDSENVKRNKNYIPKCHLYCKIC